MSEGPDDGEVAGRRGKPEDVVEAFEAMPIPLGSLTGPRHVLVTLNAAYRALLGRAAAIGTPMADSLPEDAGQELRSVLDRVFTTGASEVTKQWRVQLAREGGAGLEDVYLDFTVVPRRDPDGSIVGLYAFAHEMTEQARARQGGQREEQARDVIAALQRELLPPGLPVLPGARIAGSYLLADADTAAGGDWFEAVPLPDGRVALVVGDVVGHGVTAAGVMGQLRAVLAERIEAGAEIGEALAAADRVARRVPGARAATVCAAVLDPTDGTVVYCTAGHPPPLLISAGGEARYLPPTGAAPLGTGSPGSNVRFPSRTDHLAVGDVLLLFTDGIIERPGCSVRAATVELARVAADAAEGRPARSEEASPVERVCSRSLELLVRATGHADDITLLAVQRVDPVPDLELCLPSDVSAVPVSRAELTQWLDAVGALGEDVMALRHAIGELVTNSVEHAYLGPDGSVDTALDGTATVMLRAGLTGQGVVRIEVADRGRWRGGSSGATRGRGLMMSTELVDELRIDRRIDGTTATVTHRLTRPARLLTSAELAAGTRSAPARPAEPERLLIVEQPIGHGQRIRVDGPVDAGTADQLRAELCRRTRGGTTALTVDLTGVTHLASAGIAVLHAAVDASQADARPLLYAAPGSVAGQVLELVALPYTSRDPDRAD